VLGAIAARTYLARHNTLQANGEWRSTKTELSRGLLGAFAYVTELQTLAGGELHLDAWHGFNEVIHRRPVGALRRLEFDFSLGKGGYLIALVDRDEEGASAGVRLSSLQWRPSSFLVLDAEGKFVRREPLSRPRLKRGEHHAVIDLSDDRIEIRIDGQPSESVRYPRRGGGYFGFRGGSTPASIDKVVATSVDGQQVVESFDAPHGAGWITAATVAAVVLVNLALFVVLRRRTTVDDKILGFQFFTLNVTLLVIVGVLYAFVLLKSSWYPRLDQTLKAAEIYFEKGAKAKTRAEIQARYGNESPAGRLRILFVGSSQTWGAGARYDRQTYVAVLESLLRERYPDGPPIECINAGISSTKAAELAPILEKEWLALGPRIVVIDLSSNDRASQGRFAVEIRRMIKSTRAAGAVPVLVQEPNSIELVDRGLVARHDDLERLGKKMGVQVIAMHQYLSSREGSGILFWDKVHLTPYGQRLMATRLAEELGGLIEEERQRIAAAAGS